MWRYTAMPCWKGQREPAAMETEGKQPTDIYTPSNAHSLYFIPDTQYMQKLMSQSSTSFPHCCITHEVRKCWEHISAFWGLIDDMTLQTPPSPKDTNIPCPRKTNHHPLHDCFFMDSTACTPLVTPRWLIMVCILQKKKSHFCAVPVFSEVLNEFFRVKVWFVYKYDGYI